MQRAKHTQYSVHRRVLEKAVMNRGIP
jgi:hypothetical protein